MKRLAETTPLQRELFTATGGQYSFLLNFLKEQLGKAISSYSQAFAEKHFEIQLKSSREGRDDYSSDALKTQQYRVLNSYTHLIKTRPLFEQRQFLYAALAKHELPLAYFLQNKLDLNPHESLEDGRTVYQFVEVLEKYFTEGHIKIVGHFSSINNFFDKLRAIFKKFPFPSRPPRRIRKSKVCPPFQFVEQVPKVRVDLSVFIPQGQHDPRVAVSLIIAGSPIQEGVLPPLSASILRSSVSLANPPPQEVAAAVLKPNFSPPISSAASVSRDDAISHPLHRERFRGESAAAGSAASEQPFAPPLPADAPPEPTRKVFNINDQICAVLTEGELQENEIPVYFFINQNKIRGYFAISPHVIDCLEKYRDINVEDIPYLTVGPAQGHKGFVMVKKTQQIQIQKIHGIQVGPWKIKFPSSKLRLYCKVLQSNSSEEKLPFFYYWTILDGEESRSRLC